MKRHCLRLFVLLAAFSFGTADCAFARPLLAAVRTDQARYTPRRRVKISVALANETERTVSRASVALSCRHLDALVTTLPTQTVTLGPGSVKTLTFTWTPPIRDFQGYWVEAEAHDASGRLLDMRSTAVDVSSTWTRFPRYGYVSAFPEQSAETSGRTIRWLNDYHVNAVQFYDWQHKHHAPLAGTAAHPAASWTNLANGTNSRQTVLEEIRSAHACGMAAMQYNLLYGAWSGYGGDGVDYHWGLWNRRDGTDQDRLPMPGGWATPVLYLFNPADPG